MKKKEKEEEEERKKNSNYEFTEKKRKESDGRMYNGQQGEESEDTLKRFFYRNSKEGKENFPSAIRSLKNVFFQFLTALLLSGLMWPIFLRGTQKKKTRNL